jgi:hypothetical protein
MQRALLYDAFRMSVQNASLMGGESRLMSDYLTQLYGLGMQVV